MGIDVEDAYRRYAGMVLRRCTVLLRDEDIALDAMQDTFACLLRHRARLKDRGLSSLLFRIATNICLNMLRHRRRHPEDLQPADVLDRIAHAADPIDGLPTRIWWDRLLGRVPVTTRTLAVLYLVDGWTLDELAVETGLSVGGVRKRLAKLSAAVRELEAIEGGPDRTPATGGAP
ncbi:MAG: sigma-70 family RNA polymerase sigma factor [Deltaproteobacteria bacterium]|nr:sigma-70 family RNA polymerase sigma factor [Deltaproteobacteria bacterium]